MQQMSLQEFKDGGYLQEVNRLFFHPRGLALFVSAEDGKITGISGIMDFRDDPEGGVFNKVDADYVYNVEAQHQKTLVGRMAKLGFDVQPVDYEYKEQT